MATVRAARGFRDALAVDGAALMNVEAGFRTLVQLYGFKPVYLPVCERRSLFDRANGDTVASKELFALDATMDEEQLVLRPEVPCCVSKYSSSERVCWHRGLPAPYAHRCTMVAIVSPRSTSVSCTVGRCSGTSAHKQGGFGSSASSASSTSMRPARLPMPS